MNIQAAFFGLAEGDYLRPKETGGNFSPRIVLEWVDDGFYSEFAILSKYSNDFSSRSIEKGFLTFCNGYRVRLISQYIVIIIVTTYTINYFLPST